MMHNPPHPGESIRDLCIEPLGMTIGAAAEHLGVSRQHLSAVINGKAAISAEMDVRLAMSFGGSAEPWMGPQAADSAEGRRGGEEWDSTGRDRGAPGE